MTSIVQSRADRFYSYCRNSWCVRSSATANVTGDSRMTFAWLAFFDAILAIAMIGAGMAGARPWIATFMGFQLFALGFM